MQGIETINSLTAYTAQTGTVSENRPEKALKGSEEQTGEKESLKAVDRNPTESVEKVSSDMAKKVSHDEERIKETAESVGKVLQKYNIGLRFGIDEESGKQYFQLVDQSENKVIKQIPSEEIIALSKKLSEIQGAFVNETV